MRTRMAERPAVNAGKAVFLYGPPGNGKSVIAEGMGRSLGGDMSVDSSASGSKVEIRLPVAAHA